MTIAGHLAGVTDDRFGSELTADLGIGDTVVNVASTVFFDEEQGGYILVDGVKLAYEAFDNDDDPDTDGPTELILTEPSTVAADDGDPVWAFDPTTGSDDAVTETIALVTIDDRDDGNAIPARIKAGLTDQFDSDFETYIGKAVELTVIAGELVLTDILGSRATPSSAIQGAEDTHFVTAGVAHQVLLSHVPLPHTEDVMWGIPQDESQWSRSGKLLTVDDPDQVGQDGDIIFVRYLYVDAGQPPKRDVAVLGSDGGISAAGAGSFDVPISGAFEGATILLATFRATAPAGWSLLENVDAAGAGANLRVYSKTSDGSETSVSVTYSAGEGSQRLGGIAVVISGAGTITSASAFENPRVDNTYTAPAVTGTPLVSYAAYDGPGWPPDEHITGVDTTMLENLQAESNGLYGLAAATDRATFTATAGASGSVWYAVTVGVVL